MINFNKLIININTMIKIIIIIKINIMIMIRIKIIIKSLYNNLLYGIDL